MGKHLLESLIELRRAVRERDESVARRGGQGRKSTQPKTRAAGQTQRKCPEQARRRKRCWRSLRLRNCGVEGARRQDWFAAGHGNLRARGDGYGLGRRSKAGSGSGVAAPPRTHG